MNKNTLLDLLHGKRNSLSSLDRVRKISEQELILLEEDRAQRDNLFTYETRDVKKIARIITLLDALNSGRARFQIEHSRLFVRTQVCYREFTHAVSAETLGKLVESYTMFVDREMHLRPFDDSYLALTRVINTIPGLTRNQMSVARMLCDSQKVYLENLYTALESIPFRKDTIVKEKYEEALRRLNQ